MSLAIAGAILAANGKYGKLGDLTVKYMQDIGRRYPNCSFYKWMFSDKPKPYNSFGNGAAMRVSACDFATDGFDQALSLAQKVTEVTHNHKEENYPQNVTSP
jgi:type I restriction enzyme M protein